MSTKKDYKSKFSDVLNRLHEISGKENEYEVAEILGFKKDTFAARKSRGSVPEKEIKIACASYGWNFEWVMYGKGENSANFVHQLTEYKDNEKALDPITAKITAMLANMSMEQRRDVLKYTEEKKLLAELKSEKKKKVV
jgi:hypothetical protein